MLKSLALTTLIIGGAAGCAAVQARQRPVVLVASERRLSRPPATTVRPTPPKVTVAKKKLPPKTVPVVPKTAARTAAATAKPIAAKGLQQITIAFKSNGECTLTAAGLGQFGCLGQTGVLYPKEFYISDDDKAGTHHSAEFDVELPYAILLWGQRGIYLHEGKASLKTTGGQHSHGCIRLAKPNAAKVYNWLQGRTKVTISYPWETAAASLPKKTMSGKTPVAVKAAPVPSRKTVAPPAAKKLVTAKANAPAAVAPAKKRSVARPAAPGTRARKSDDTWGFF